MISTPELATFGAAVAAIVTFHSGSHTDIMQRICDAAPAGLDLDDRDQARDFCIHYDFDPVALGDTVRVLFDQPTITPRSDVRTAIVTWHEAREGDSNDDKHAAATALIEQLLGFSGIHLTT